VEAEPDGCWSFADRIGGHPVKTTDVHAKTEAAFPRSAEIDARRIAVTASDGKATLT
jgi:hypothetical protein